MLVELTRLRGLMAQVCDRTGVPVAGRSTVVEHFLEGELRGKPTHGVTKFCYESQFFADRLGSPVPVREHGATAVVDGRREIGPLAAAYATDLVVERARRYGIGLVGVLNAQRYGVLAAVAERIAGAGMLGVVANTSRAEVTAPGARRPFLGVNPFCFAAPTDGEPLVADFSGSRAPMGNLWDARRGDAELRPGSFADESGAVTDDPESATWGLVTDERGLALSLLVQVLTGAVFGFPMGTGVESTWTTGYCYLAVDPGGVRGGPGFTAELGGLVRAAGEALATADHTDVRLPGTASARRRAERLAAGTVELPESVLDRLHRLAAGDPAAPHQG